MTFDPRAFLLRLFHAAVEAASPERCVPPHLPRAPKGRTIVVGAGKASAAMARAVEDHWPGELSGLVVTRYGHAAPCRRIDVMEAGHPTPDRASVDAAERMLALLGGLTAEDLVLALISGGGSALLTLPPPGISLEDKQAVTRALLNSGAPISEINCVRKHLSRIKGGHLALAAQPAAVLGLIISDVPHDDPALVASGPTTPDASTSAEARSILEKYDLHPPPAINRWLMDPRSETPKPDDKRFARVENRVVMSSRLALAESARVAESAGFAVHNLGDLEGEASVLGRSHAKIALRLRAAEKPCIILSGGETTVTLRGEGRGGRNSEYLLSLCIALAGADGIWAIACDTDGIDGTGDNAGAIINPDTLERAEALLLDAPSALALNRSHDFFANLNDLVVTGPTRTNVNDFRAILIT